MYLGSPGGVGKETGTKQLKGSGGSKTVSPCPDSHRSESCQQLIAWSQWAFGYGMAPKYDSYHWKILSPTLGLCQRETHDVRGLPCSTACPPTPWDEIFLQFWCFPSASTAVLFILCAGDGRGWRYKLQSSGESWHNLETLSNNVSLGSNRLMPVSLSITFRRGVTQVACDHSWKHIHVGETRFRLAFMSVEWELRGIPCLSPKDQRQNKAS